MFNKLINSPMNQSEKNEDHKIYIPEESKEYQPSLNSPKNNIHNTPPKTNSKKPFSDSKMPRLHIFESAKKGASQFMKFSPMNLPKPDFTRVEENEKTFNLKEKGSNKKKKTFMPQSPKKSPAKKFFTPNKSQGGLNFFRANPNTFRRLNLDIYTQNDEEYFKNEEDQPENQEKNMSLNEEKLDDLKNEKNETEYCGIKIHDLSIDDQENEGLSVVEEKNPKEAKRQESFKKPMDLGNKILRAGNAGNGNAQNVPFSLPMNNYRKTSVNENFVNKIDNDDRRKLNDKFITASSSNIKVNDFLKGKKTHHPDSILNSNRKNSNNFDLPISINPTPKKRKEMEEDEENHNGIKKLSRKLAFEDEDDNLITNLFAKPQVSSNLPIQPRNQCAYNMQQNISNSGTSLNSLFNRNVIINPDQGPSIEMENTLRPRRRNENERREKRSYQNLINQFSSDCSEDSCSSQNWQLNFLGEGIEDTQRPNNPALKPSNTGNLNNIQNDLVPNNPQNQNISFFKKTSDKLPFCNIFRSRNLQNYSTDYSANEHQNNQNEVNPLENPDEITSRFETEFKNLGVIDKGENGVVYKCISLENDEICALKCSKNIANKNLKKSLDNLTIDLKENEGKTNMPHLSKYVLIYDEIWEENNFIFIKQELCKLGDLNSFLDLLEEKDFNFTSEFYWDIIYQMVNGLQYVNNLKYLHMDVKPTNFFVTSQGVVKLGDFDLTRKNSTFSSVEFEAGDSTYISPEALKANNFTELDRSCDVFSLGLSIIEVLLKIELPPNGPLWANIRQEGFRFPPEITQKLDKNIVTEELMDLIYGMIHPDPKKRFTLDFILNHCPQIFKRTLLERENSFKKCYKDFLETEFVDIAWNINDNGSDEDLNESRSEMDLEN